jgi:hypothetical protein
MNALLEAYSETLDSLLNAGDAGQTLRREHLPHVDYHSWPALLHTELVGQDRVEVALPPVLLLGYCHIAEVNLQSQRICYKRVLNQQEGTDSTGVRYLHKAQTFARQGWLEELQADSLKDCTLAQTRSIDNEVTWKVLGSSAYTIGTITRKPQFMELARVARVIYTD